MILGFVIAATIVEGIVEYLVSILLEPLNSDPTPVVRNLNLYQLATRYIAVALGIGVSFAYQLDLPATLGLVSPYPWVGYLLTGIVIGRGSNYLHDLVSSWKQ